MVDLARISDSGFDLLRNPGGKFDLVPIEECETCCCLCDDERDLICSASETDFGALVPHRTIQVDVNLTPTLDPLVIGRIQRDCGAAAIVYPTGFNGTYLLTPTRRDALVSSCDTGYAKIMHSEMACTHPNGQMTLCMVVILDIVVQGFFPYFGGNSITVANVTLSTSTGYIRNNLLGQIDGEFGGREQASQAIFNLFTLLQGGGASQLIGRPVGALMNPSQSRSVQVIYDITQAQPFPYRQAYQFTPSDKCRPECNTIGQVGPPDWQNTRIADTSTGLSSADDGPGFTGTIQIGQV